MDVHEWYTLVIKAAEALAIGESVPPECLFRDLCRKQDVQFELDLQPIANRLIALGLPDPYADPAGHRVGWAVIADLIGHDAQFRCEPEFEVAARKWSARQAKTRSTGTEEIVEMVEIGESKKDSDQIRNRDAWIYRMGMAGKSAEETVYELEAIAPLRGWNSLSLSGVQKIRRDYPVRFNLEKIPPGKRGRKRSK